jgi:hypothetical protein
MGCCLIDRFGLDDAGIRVLDDADPAVPQPTGGRILPLQLAIISKEVVYSLSPLCLE